MPTVPRNAKCATLGCNNPRARLSAQCTEHGGRDKWESKYNGTEARRDSNGMYNTPQWKRHRTAQLSRSPMCAACLLQGIVTPATTVDHVFPWVQIGKHAFFHNVFQSLCAGCHTHKTHLEQRGIFRHYQATARDLTIGDYTRMCG